MNNQTLINRLIDEISSSYPLTFDQVNFIYRKVGNSIDNTLKCIEYALERNLDPEWCSQTNDYLNG